MRILIAMLVIAGMAYMHLDVLDLIHFSSKEV
jgi:hypothetical protein